MTITKPTTQEYFVTASYMAGKTKKITAINQLVQDFDCNTLKAGGFDDLCHHLTTRIKEIDERFAGRKAYVAHYRPDGRSNPLIVFHIANSDNTASLSFREILGEITI